MSMQSGGSTDSKNRNRAAVPVNVNMGRHTISYDSDSNVSSDWGPGFEDLPLAQQQIIKELRIASNVKEFTSLKEQSKKQASKATKLMNANMISRWNVQQNKSRGGANAS